MGRVELQQVVKRFKDVVAVERLNLTVREGEFFTLLGPSGCGKTTILRMIAGFYHPSEGRILFDGNDVTDLPPHRRDTGMVFQNYALFPHMTVMENVAFGLQVRKRPKDEIKRRVEEALAQVRLAGYGERRISQLSGGQQQRVALARALVIRPRILLLDEPLSNLDARLRDEMRAEIIRLQRSLGITTVYVTHDQTEALSMSDRIAVFNQGVCQQVGTPMEVYNTPNNSFGGLLRGGNQPAPLHDPTGHFRDGNRLLRRSGPHDRQLRRKRRYAPSRSRRKIDARLHPARGNPPGRRIRPQRGQGDGHPDPIHRILSAMHIRVGRGHHPAGAFPQPAPEHRADSHRGSPVV